MRNYKRAITLGLLLSFVAISLTGCAGPPPPKPEEIEGKWIAIKKEAYTLGGGSQVGFIIEFLKDKTVNLPSGKGNWEILKDGRVKIDIPNMTMYGELKERLLTITMPDNQGKVIFKRP